MLLFLMLYSSYKPMQHEENGFNNVTFVKQIN